MWDLVAKNDNPEEFRAYSMANHPAEGNMIMLNIRIATPPPHLWNDVPPGVASSYILNLVFNKMLFFSKGRLEIELPDPYKEYFFEYLDFDECSHSVVNLWLKHHKKFHKKVRQYYKNKRVVYKSPAHSARIQHLIKIYPNASFVHITRHPLDIIQSSIHRINVFFEKY